ncbi:HAD family hydrolase [Desulfoluna spongiiphila]|uniref:phosphoglycolate phosphatase n=1 Tax=Desulfoluna spongiiphila TaxID=419481 RepID=A0A1G5F3B1_9BACT|nr:HAD family hydrolase [Desulfoluna spongiiphila]SCY33664.1 haloacid dehalogenase superfamily, subfamily IA, variant 1 with third motif having Dx(3-4)D or Dx(3-4)E [Desulfoluna spongiiphila]VVS94343.1 c1.5: had beta-pgm phosphatase like [Desulfoluna spongiiphila]
MKQKITPEAIRVVAFDCDGVMFDTEETNRIYYNTILDRFGMPSLSDEQFRYVHMATVGQALDYLFEGRVDMGEVRAATAAFDYASLIPHMKMEPSLIRVLTTLAPRCKRAIATNRANTMEAVLAFHGLSDLFELVVTSMVVEHPKPAPDQLHKIMDHFDVAAHEILYIGDSTTDQLAAQAAGVPFVAFGNPELTADAHMDSLDEIPPLLGLGNAS